MNKAELCAFPEQDWSDQQDQQGLFARLEQELSVLQPLQNWRKRWDGARR